MQYFPHNSPESNILPTLANRMNILRGSQKAGGMGSPLLIARFTISRMRKIILFAALLLLTHHVVVAQTQKPKATDLRSVLLEQLQSTHNKAEWFVPIDTAVANLPP